MKNCKRKISKKSFKNLCKSKLDFIKLQICRNDLERLIYDLSICKDEKIDYVAIHSYVSAPTVKRILKSLYNRVMNFSPEAFEIIFDTL